MTKRQAGARCADSGENAKTGILDGAATRAVFSECGRYRFALERIWSEKGGRVLFVMLNPSLASESRNDPTVARCHNRAKAMNGGRKGAYRVCNLFSLISPYPAFLEQAAKRGDGPENDRAIADACRWARTVVCAWGGSKPFILERAKAVEAILRRNFGGPLQILALNASGTPRHPLYVADAAPLAEWH